MILKNQNGMSLLEVTVAILILGLVTVPLVGLFLRGSIFTAVARHEVTALHFAQEIMEEIKSIPFEQLGKARGSMGNDKITLAGDVVSDLMGYLVLITAGEGKGQVREITEFNVKTKIATVKPSWEAAKQPDNTSSYIMHKNSYLIGTVQGSGSNTIKLSESENSSADFYKDYYVEISAGAGSGQIRKITGYDGNTKVATVESNWDIRPDKTSLYKLYRYSYEVDVTENESNKNLKTITVTVFYRAENTELKKVSLTTEKLKR